MEASNRKDRFGDVEVPNERPVYVTRRAMIIMGGTIGIVIGVVIILLALTLTRVSNELKHRRRSDADIAAIAKRVFPKQHAADEQVLLVLKRCKSNPACRKALRDVVLSAKESKAKPVTRNKPRSKPSTPNSTRSSDSHAGTRETGGNTGVAPPKRVTKPTHNGSGGGNSGNTGSVPQPQPIPQPTPTPVVGVQVPLVPTTCIGNLIHINCQ